MLDKGRRFAALEGLDGPFGLVAAVAGPAEPDGVAADDDEAGYGFAAGGGGGVLHNEGKTEFGVTIFTVDQEKVD